MLAALGCYARCLEQSFSAPVRFASKSLRKTVSGALAQVWTARSRFEMFRSSVHHVRFSFPAKSNLEVRRAGRQSGMRFPFLRKSGTSFRATRI